MNFVLKIVIASVTISNLLSCQKFVAIEPAPDLINTEKVFANDATALSAINGVYLKLRGISLSVTNGGLSVFTGLSADEIYNTSASTTYDPFYRDSIPSDNNTILRNFWNESYFNIYKVNAIIEGLMKSAGLTESVKNQLLGEAKFIRSLYYFYLVNLFGDVPLITSTVYETNQKMPRTPATLIYQLITNDLLEAENLLIPNYPTLGKVRVNKFAATALLARVYLFHQNWPAAEAKAAAVINSGTYSLIANLASIFVKNTTETILEIAPPNESGNTAEGANFIPASATIRPAFAMTNSLVNSFEAADKRKVNWIKTNLVSGITYSYPFKYRVKSNTSATEYNIVLRLSEQYLIRAEARTHQSKLSEAAADVNVIRSRAGIPNITAGQQSDLLLAIEKERQLELFCEWGHRWLDLKRTKRITAVLTPLKPTWQNFAELYPVPFSQLQVNVFLTQNPGY